MKWNRKSVSVICRVTWFIIRPTIWNEFDIVCIKLWAFFFFLQILHAISKVQLCCSIFSIKTFSKLVPSFGEVVGPFGNFFVSFLCLRLFNIFSICSRDVFHPVKCKARGFFATAFHYCLLISQCFAVLLIVEIFTLVIVMSKAIVCIWKFFRLVVFFFCFRLEVTFYGEIYSKKPKLLKLNSMAVFIFFCFISEITFLG